MIAEKEHKFWQNVIVSDFRTGREGKGTYTYILKFLFMKVSHAPVSAELSSKTMENFV